MAGGIDRSGALDRPVRIIFWNAWLLRPRIWPGRPAFPGSDRLFAPAVRERASAIGEVLAGRFDVCALAECFEPEEQELVLAAWTGRKPTVVRGPQRGRFPRFTGSGLLTVIDGVDVLRHASHSFQAGRDLRDADTFATKSAMLVSLDLGPDRPGLDVFSTHLISGGDLLPIPGAADRNRHHRDRMAQVDELLEFIGANRDPANAAALVGDFNVPATDRTWTDPSFEYLELAAKLKPLGFCDVWATQGVGNGPTGLFRQIADLQPDPEEPDRIADVETTPAAAVARGERIDYVWLAQPSAGSPVASGDVAVADRPRRWAFPRPLRNGCASFLSDHLALSVDLHIASNLSFDNRDAVDMGAPPCRD